MKSKALLLIVTFIMSTTVFSQKIFEQKDLSGSWLGKLKVQGIELRLVFNISQDTTGMIKATLDSPDQGAKGIKMDDVSFDSGKLKISAPALGAFYEGKIINIDSIEGIWNQGGQAFDLNLKKQTSELTLNRPQEPKPPYPYDIIEVKFKNEHAGHTLAGTLTIPKGVGPFPAVILISGSGSQNRNEELMGHKPFWVIADYLTKEGIAVLRYDDQGVGSSGGSQANTTSEDYSYDAEAAFKFLRLDKRMNPKAIGFAGHSEGGLIAPMVASRNSEPGFIISLAGPAIRGKELLLLQSQVIKRGMGMEEVQIEKDQEQSAKMFDIIMNEENNEKAQQAIIELYTLAFKNEGKSDEEIKGIAETLKQNLPIAAYHWMRYFLKTDPADFLAKIKCPVLVLNGSKDVQVPSKQNLDAYERIFKKYGLKNCTLIELENHNHLFQHCTTGLPAEYNVIEETFSPKAMEEIVFWIKLMFID